MTCFGSKALHSSRTYNSSVLDMGKGENNYSKHGGRRKSRRPTKEHQGFDDTSNLKSSKSTNASQTSFIRKQIDPETTKYFMEIANLFEGTGTDLDERSAICGNALEETRGKELELATDYIISHTLQTLLQGCEVDQLCRFLKSCAKDFPSIATDKSGSHVAETALRSLALHLQDTDAYSVIEDTLTRICEVIALNPFSIMCDRYGSHVLRSLLCICKGLPLDSSEEHHVTKSFTVLAERFNIKAPQFDGSNPPQLQHDFPDLLKFLVTEMLKYVKQDIVSVLFDQYSSLVLQTCLKLLAGEDQELMHIIYILLGFHDENNEEGNFLETIPVQDILSSLEDNAFSHLMEVILQVAPETLYDKILTKVFKNSLFKIASHHCGSFVVQALVSSVRCQGQMDLIWEELGGKFKELLEVGRSGVIASILVATQRLQTHGHKCCQVLAAAVCSTSDIPICIIPRLLFLDNYLWCEDKLNWKWAAGDKMHVLGCLMLQTVFKYPSECFQSYITSITSVEDDHVLQITKDARGGRVIEAFLSSDVSAKHKRKLIVKLKGHFGELSMLPSGSFTVEKCFTASNAVLKETIVSELLDIRSELSKTRQGPHLLRKLDVDGYAARPDQWRSRQASKKKIYKDFCAAFGSRKTTTSSSTTRKFVGELSSHSSQPKSVKEMRDEIGKYLMPSSLGTNFPGIEHSMAKLGFSGFKHRREGVVEESNNKKFKHSMCNDATLKRRSDEDEIGKPSRKKHKM